MELYKVTVSLLPNFDEYMLVTNAANKLLGMKKHPRAGFANPEDVKIEAEFFGASFKFTGPIDPASVVPCNDPDAYYYYGVNDCLCFDTYVEVDDSGAICRILSPGEDPSGKYSE